MWTADPKEMNSGWVGERVAVPHVDDIKLISKIKNWNQGSIEDAKDSTRWGPNQFPSFGGTGQIWESISKLIPQQWFRFGHTVSSINSEKKTIYIVKTDPDLFSEIRSSNIHSTS